ncbi:MAG: hypothetical protein IKK18_00275 [Clostridia bacterium]|nr:hypothetical protein [Clostridia bacterium]
MKKISVILLSIMMVSLLSGCYDYIESNDLSYVVAIGVDKGKEESLYNYTLQFARPTQISGGSSEEGGSGEETIGTVKVEAPSIYSALNVANHVISKTFTLSHTKIIVISDEIAKEGIGRIVDSAGRSTELRPTVFFCVSAGEAGKYLESVKPVIEINPVKYYRLIFESPNSSYIPKNDSGSIFQNLKADTEQCTLPYVGVGKGSSGESSSSGSSSGGSSSGGGSSQKEQSSGGENQTQSPQPSSEKENNIPINEKGFEYHMKEYIAGKLDIEKQNESEVLGCAVFKEDKMIGVLSGIESEMLNILSGRFTNGYSVLYVPQTPDNPATIRIEQQKKPKIDISIEDGIPKIKIKLALLGNFVSVPTDYIIENELLEFEESTSQYIEEFALELLDKTVKEYNSDIVGFGKNAKGKFLTNKEFEDFNWNEAYKNAQISCEVEFSIRRTGLTMRSSE